MLTELPSHAVMSFIHAMILATNSSAQNILVNIVKRIFPQTNSNTNEQIFRFQIYIRKRIFLSFGYGQSAECTDVVNVISVRYHSGSRISVTKTHPPSLACVVL